MSTFKPLFLFLNLAFVTSPTKNTVFGVQKNNNSQRSVANNVIFKVVCRTMCPKISMIKIDQLVNFKSANNNKEKQHLFQHHKFHNVIATITADKTMFLPFLCLFSPPGCHPNHFPDLQIIILESQTGWETGGGVGGRRRGGLKENYSPLPQQPALMCLEQDTIPELLHLSCSENLSCTWQLSVA